MPTSPLTSFLPEVERLVDEIPRDEAPALLGDLERLRARLWMRLNEAQISPTRAPKRPDRLLSVDEAAKVLGMKPRWVRDHADEIGAKVRLPGKVLRFSERKLERWIEQRTT